MWLFCRISVISDFLLLGIGLKTKVWTPPPKIFIFQLFLLKLYQIHFCVCLCLFLLAEFVIPLFNCFFRDFRGFRDFRIFGLVLYLIFLLKNNCFRQKKGVKKEAYSYCRSHDFALTNRFWEWRHEVKSCTRALKPSFVKLF